ncbi:RNA polymerase sigma factor [Nocardia tengchongensis]|uniref:RNA polymerase sigma factor n=1 Tax=Nocardia tengchongensis TaxID=2055889 RepID=UPI0036CFDE72
MIAREIEDLLRDLAPQVLGALVRRYGHFDLAEDAVQEALLAATTQWPPLPDEPRTWLIRVASRKLIDLLRSEQARREREEVPVAPSGPVSAQDDSLILLFMCCHPALPRTGQIALTLRAVGGLTTGEIARALFAPEATMGQRISRAKKTIKQSGVSFAMPAEHAERLDAVLQVLYLIFNEGYTSTSGPVLARVELSTEAIRLARMMRRSLPGDGEVAGLLALMLLTDARRAARTGPGDMLIPMAEQDRTLWDRTQIAEGVALVTAAMSRNKPGPYQIQAAIAAVHDEAPTPDATDWEQILALYTLLDQMSENPMVTLNRVVALAMARGVATGFALLEQLRTDRIFAEHHRFAAVEAHLAELAGDLELAAVQYRSAAHRTLSEPERRYLVTKAARLES